MNSTQTLGQLEIGVKAMITDVNAENTALTQRLLEMGFLEGAEVEILHVSPFGSDPIAVRVRGALIALRRNEANFIQVQKVETQK